MSIAMNKTSDAGRAYYQVVSNRNSDAQEVSLAMDSNNIYVYFDNNRQLSLQNINIGHETVSLISSDNKTIEFFWHASENSLYLSTLGIVYKIETTTLLESMVNAAQTNEDGQGIITAPMPGIVTDILVAPNQHVNKGDAVGMNAVLVEIQTD